MATAMNQNNFEELVLKADKPVLVDFWAPWCGPCRMLAPVLEELEEKYADRVTIAKVDVDENTALAQQYGVMSIPMVMLFKNGEVVAKSLGYQPRVAFEQMLDKEL
ncbi:MAG: thioredoxin [Clostridia bacterium]|nr:thioredoxin [Clostridia bacterium]